MQIRIQSADFDLRTEVEALREARADIGAVVAFVGTVRDMSDGRAVADLTLEHYPGMTEKSIREVVEAASRRWSLIAYLVIHRVGVLLPRDQIVLVAIASAHRGEAFAACEYIMDHLKTSSPFWKKELTDQGPRWVDARLKDDAAVKKWRDSDL